MATVRYWLTHEPPIWFGQDFPRMAAITLGNARDAQSYVTLESLYLDAAQDEMVRAEAFRAVAKIDPARSGGYVIKELSSGKGTFAIYADIALKEAYGTSFDAMKTNMEKAMKRHDVLDLSLPSPR